MEHSVLLVQHDPEERARVLRAFQNVAPSLRISVAPSAAEAYAQVAGRGKYANREEYFLPQLILLDIDLIREPGLDIVRWLREKSADLHVPVIVITEGADTAMIDRAYDAGACSCLLKSNNEGVLEEMAMGIADYAALLNDRSRTAACVQAF